MLYFQKLFLSFFSLALFVVPAASAKHIGLERIQTNLHAIQVAALKTKSSKLLKNIIFKSHDTYIVKEKGLFKYFIVNVPKRQYKSTFIQMQREFPSAFNATSKIRSIAHAKPKQKTYARPLRLHDKKEQGELYHFSYLGLNAKSILQTRRKFY